MRVLRHAVNRGKGAAVRTGLQEARGIYTIIQDADLEYSPEDFPCLLDPLLKGDADVVFGSRYLRFDGGRCHNARMLDLGVFLLNFILRVLYGVRVTDVATCYKVTSTDNLRAMDLRSERFEFCAEVAAKASRMQLRILEVPIRYNPRTVYQGKKLRWQDGFEAIKTLWRWRSFLPSSPNSKAAMDALDTAPGGLVGGESAKTDPTEIPSENMGSSV